MAHLYSPSTHLNSILLLFNSTSSTFISTHLHSLYLPELTSLHSPPLFLLFISTITSIHSYSLSLTNHLQLFPHSLLLTFISSSLISTHFYIHLDSPSIMPSPPFTSFLNSINLHLLQPSPLSTHPQSHPHSHPTYVHSLYSHLHSL